MKIEKLNLVELSVQEAQNIEGGKDIYSIIRDVWDWWIRKCLE